MYVSSTKRNYWLQTWLLRRAGPNDEARVTIKQGTDLPVRQTMSMKLLWLQQSCIQTYNGKKRICFAHDQVRKFEQAKSLLLTNSVQYSIKQMQNPVTNNCCAYWWRAATYFCCFWLPNHVEKANKVHEDGVRVDATRPVAAVGIDPWAEGRTSESAGAVE